MNYSWGTKQSRGQRGDWSEKRESTGWYAIQAGASKLVSVGCYFWRGRAGRANQVLGQSSRRRWGVRRARGTSLQVTRSNGCPGDWGSPLSILGCARLFSGVPGPMNRTLLCRAYVRHHFCNLPRVRGRPRDRGVACNRPLCRRRSIAPRGPLHSRKARQHIACVTLNQLNAEFDIQSQRWFLQDERETERELKKKWGGFPVFGNKNNCSRRLKNQSIARTCLFHQQTMHYCQFWFAFDSTFTRRRFRLEFVTPRWREKDTRILDSCQQVCQSHWDVSLRSD